MKSERRESGIGSYSVTRCIVRWLTAGGLGAVLVVVAGSTPATANFEWQAREQVTPYGLAKYEHLAKQLVTGAAAGEYHLVVRRWPHGAVGKADHGQGLYYARSAAPTGWPATPELFTPEPGDPQQINSLHSTDFRFGVDLNDEVHVVFEAHNYNSSDPNDFYIAYKYRGDSNLWDSGASPVIISVAGAASPRIFVDRDNEMLHMVWRGSNPSDSGNTWLCYRQKSIAGQFDPYDWSGYPTSYVTPAIYPKQARGSILVDAGGGVHFFGDHVVELGGGLGEWTIGHVWGTPPTVGGTTWSTPPVDTLDTFTAESDVEPPNDEEEATSSGYTQVSGLLPATERMYYAWRRLNNPVDKEKIIAFATLLDPQAGPATPNRWFPAPPAPGLEWEHAPLSTPDDSVHSNTPTIAVDGTDVHVFWQEHGNAIFHRYTTDSYTQPWSPASEVVPDRRTNSARPTAAVAGGILGIGYSSKDNNESADPDNRLQGHFRKGTYLGNTATGSSMWKDVVTLDRDFTVPEGATLTIAPGTAVLVSNVDVSEGGLDPDRVELIVHGSLVLGEAGEALVRFESVDASKGGWQGIWLGATGTIEVKGPAEIADAVIGLAVPDPYDTGYPDVLRNQIGFSNWRDNDVALMAAPGEKTSWSTFAEIGATFYVAPAGTLQIAAGTNVDITPNEDIEIRADGLILANGTDSQPITLTSNSTAGSWNGVRFRDSPDTSISRLDYVNFESPTYAVTVDSLSGNLFHCGFDPASAGDIYVPQDTRVPKGWEWNLDAGTRVVAKADEDERNAQWGEDSLHVEIQINGNVTTTGTQGNPVVFTSTGSVGEFSGDDWAGLTVWGSDYPDGVVHIDGAKFENASFPLTLIWAWPYSCEVENSFFHYYEKAAITDVGSNAQIHDNFIERGDLLGGTVGNNGIHIWDSFAGVARDTVLVQRNAGILLDGSSTYCKGPPGYPFVPGTVTVSDVVLVGDPEFNSKGILVKWNCHETQTLIQNSNIQNWAERGISIVNSSDVTVSCNCVKGNAVGLAHSRQYPPIDAYNGFNNIRQNNLEDNAVYNVQSLNMPVSQWPGMRFGVTGDSQTGGNRLKAADFPAYNYAVTATEVSRTDSAQASYWYGRDGILLANPDSLNLVEAEQVIDTSGYGSGDPCGSEGDACALPPSMARLPNRTQANVDPEDPQESATGIGSAALPTELAVYPPVPNPAGQSVRIRLDVPASSSIPVDVAVYDVTGRRVRQVVEGVQPAGRHTFVWDLTDSRGRTVSPGVFFVRAIAGDYRRVHKLVVVH